MNKKPPYLSKAKDLQKLKENLSKGDPEAIADMYRIYFQRLCNYGVQVVGTQHQEDVEDVVQDFFMWLAQNCHKTAGILNFEVYLFQSIRRNLYSRLKSLQQSQKSFASYVSKTNLLLENKTYSPEYFHIQLEEQQSRSAYIQSQLKKLPAYQKEILYLRYFEDKSYKEISAILSINEQVAYNYVSRAIKRLKKQLTHSHLLFFLIIGVC